MMEPNQSEQKEIKPKHEDGYTLYSFIPINSIEHGKISEEIKKICLDPKNMVLDPIMSINSKEFVEKCQSVLHSHTRTKRKVKYFKESRGMPYYICKDCFSIYKDFEFYKLDTLSPNKVTFNRIMIDEIFP
jgi:hypothetical protein